MGPAAVRFRSATPEVGDWVRAAERRPIPVTLTDRVLDRGIRRGTRGVVVGHSGRRVIVDFDAGFGTQRATVRASAVRVVRYRGGVRAPHRRASKVGWARFGVMLVLLAPFVVQAASYVAAHHTTNGLLPALAAGVVDSFVGVIDTAFRAPLQTGLYLLLVAGLWRFAFGHRHR